jgi:hypothetical protein
MKKIRGDKAIVVTIIYTWKYHKETPLLYFKQGKTEQILPWGCWCQWEGGSHGERVNKVCTCVYMYANAKMIPVGTISGIRGGK